ncbi:MAG: AAA family ATPase [Gemmataceae bacterium]
MLRELSVQNLALIEDVRVELHPGFCAWTGETGAGKSLLLGALGLLLGDRGSVELLRAGADELRVTGRFELGHAAVRSAVERILDTALDDGEAILTRRLSRAGRGAAYVNDQPVAVKTLEQIGTLLVDIHGQRETQSLLAPAFQLQALDAYGTLGKPRQAYLDAAARLREARKRYQRLAAERQHRQRELTLLRFEREELDQAALEPGELAELNRERQRLANAAAGGVCRGQLCGPVRGRGLRRRAAGQGRPRGLGLGRAGPGAGRRRRAVAIAARAGPRRRPHAAPAGRPVGGRPRAARRGRGADPALAQAGVEVSQDHRRADRLPRRPGRAGAEAPVGGGRPRRAGGGDVIAVPAVEGRRRRGFPSSGTRSRRS